jgi:hypothetical protein
VPHTSDLITLYSTALYIAICRHVTHTEGIFNLIKRQYIRVHSDRLNALHHM